MARTTFALALGLGLILVGGAGCVEERPGLTATQSLRVTLVAPADPGAPDRRLDDTARDLMISVEAIGPDGGRDADFAGDVDVYAQFLGSLTPELGDPPLTRVNLSAGVSAATPVTLPSAFGATVLWVDDGSRDGATYAAGTSPVLWYRDPFVADVSTPPDPMALNALSTSPLQDKQVIVNGSRYGARGRLIVTSTYAQGYTVSDTECADAAGTPPCVAGDFDHVLVFSFSRPRDEEGRGIEVGQAITGFAGGVTEFNGLTELSFPQTFVTGEPDVDLARVPAARDFELSWLSNVIEFEKIESGLMRVPQAMATVCPLDEEYETFKQWKLDLGSGCGDPDRTISVITAGVVTDFDPATVVGMQVGVTGTLRPVNIGTFNVWILFPRSSADLVLP